MLNQPSTPHPHMPEGINSDIMDLLAAGTIPALLVVAPPSAKVKAEYGRFFSAKCLREMLWSGFRMHTLVRDCEANPEVTSYQTFPHVLIYLCDGEVAQFTPHLLIEEVGQKRRIVTPIGSLTPNTIHHIRCRYRAFGMSFDIDDGPVDDTMDALRQLAAIQTVRVRSHCSVQLNKPIERWWHNQNKTAPVMRMHQANHRPILTDCDAASEHSPWARHTSHTSKSESIHGMNNPRDTVRALREKRNG